MLYRPYQRAEHAQASEFRDVNEEQAPKPWSLTENPSGKARARRWRRFPAASEFIGAYGDHFFGGGVGLERREKVKSDNIFNFFALFGYFSTQTMVLGAAVWK